MPRAKSPRNGDATRKITPITQGITQESRKASATVNLQDDLQGEIRIRAYELYEQRGRTPAAWPGARAAHGNARDGRWQNDTARAP